MIKSLISTILLYSIFISCKTSSLNIDKETQEENSYVMAYKTSVFYSCYNEATRGKLNDLCNETNDLKLAQEASIILNTGIDHASIIGKNEIKNIKSIDYADYEDKKPFLSHCFAFANSTFVDSIARNQYKRTK